MTNTAPAEQDITIGVIGLGYIGLPLAIEFGKRHRTVGYDLATRKVESCRRGVDPSGEVAGEAFAEATHLTFHDEPSCLRAADFILVAVPTPVDDAHHPDFAPLASASAAAGRNLKRGAVVIYESTVYPGATEEVCIPILERESGLVWKRDFWVGYSPERINPGDRKRTLTKVIKVVSGDTPETLERVAALYGSIITAGVHRASSLKIAEAAKVIENTQRDLNIALVNELSIIFDRLGIDTLEVLEAAGTKWNFLPFRPGLVGGHCIGVDPYYLTHKAEKMGYHPEVILAGRRINDGMPAYIASRMIKLMLQQGLPKGARVTVLGLTFKENCPDIRNSKVAELAEELKEYGCQVTVHDPLADREEARHEYGIELADWADLRPGADAVVAAVAHDDYRQRPLADLVALARPGGVFVDVKSIFPMAGLQQAGLRVWRL